MKIIGIIPSRYASTRFPGKPLAEILGKPMVQRVYEQASRSTLISDVVVATDDERIFSAVTSFGGSAEMTPVDIQSGSDRIALVAKNRNADIVVNIQGDEPLIDPQMIDRTIQQLINNPDAAAATAVKRIGSSKELFDPNVVKAVLDNNGNALYFSRSPVPYVRDAHDQNDWIGQTTIYKHFGLYVYRGEFLQHYTRLSPSPLEQSEKLEQLRILEHGFTITCVVTEYESFPVDTPEDLQRVIFQLSNTAI